jgi:kumamolisin
MRLQFVFARSGIGLLAVIAGISTWASLSEAVAYGRSSSLSPRLSETRLLAREDPAREHNVVVSLDLTNRDELESFLADVQNPASPNYRRFLTPEQFNSRYAPSPDAEQRLVDHLRANGLKVTRRFPNRLLVAAAGSVAALERTFSVELHTVSFRGEAHYAAINEPSFPDDLAPHVLGVVGLDDLVARHPHGRARRPAVAPHAALGGNYSFSPNDLKVFYDDSGSYDGSGQTIVIAGAYKWSANDVTNFDTQWGLPALPAGSNQVCTGGQTDPGCKIDFSSDNSFEVTMDVESAHGIAPGAKILNYMAASTFSADFITMYNAIVTDNPGHVVTTSWGSCEAQTPAADQSIDDAIFANANAIGQSWFAASGDDGSRDCGDHVVTVDHPANSPHVMGAGGTSSVCSAGMIPGAPACAGYGFENGWSGSGGGVSQQFSRPAFQKTTSCGVPSGTKRLVPDVSLQADPYTPGIFVFENGGWAIAGGTSDAAPQWAAIFAQLNQMVGGTGLGNPGALLYGMCDTNAFHDITAGSNGDYNAAAGYDLVTGLGSPDIANLLANAALPTATATPTPAPNQTPSTPTPTGPTNCTDSAPTNPCVPGGGAKATDCNIEWRVYPVPPYNRMQIPINALTCTDGDPSCDFDGAINHSCTFHVGMCLNNNDPRLVRCSPLDIDTFEVKRPSPGSTKPADMATVATLENQGVAFGLTVVRGGTVVSSGHTNSTADQCSGPLDIVVPLRALRTGNYRTGRVMSSIQTISSDAQRDSDKLRLQCKPAQ